MYDSEHELVIENYDISLNSLLHAIKEHAQIHLNRYIKPA